MFRRLYLVLIFLSIYLPGWCFSFFSTAADTAKKKKLTINDYDKLVSYYRYYKPDSAVYLAKQGIQFARQCRNDSGVAVMLNQLGMIDDNFGRFEESRDKYLQALAIYERAQNVKGISVETIRLGVVELRKGNYDRAIGYFLQALKVSEQGKNPPGKMEAYLTLAEGYMGQRKYEKALSYLNKAEALNQILPFSNLSLNIYNNYGVIYRETGNYPQAIAYLRKGIALSNLPKYQGLNITLTNNLAKVYSKLGDGKRSIALQQAALAKAREIHNYLRELQTLTGLADTYTKIDPPKAVGYLNEALQLVREKGSRKQEMEVLNDLAAIYKSQKNYLAAFNAKEKEHAIADSFYYQSMARQINSLQSAYELQKSEAKVKELRLLNSRDELQRNLILLVTMSCVVILIVVCLSLYRSNQLNKLLNSANVSLRESNTVKDKLFSVLAHDLRAPFASIIEMLYFINDDDITDDERHMMVDKLAVTSSASLETLNMLLRWGQMQIKGVKINPDKVQPQLVFERSLALLTSAAEKKQIKIKDVIPKGLELITDPDHFEFVVRNLLSNAIKFTPTGGTVTMGCETDTATNQLLCWVSDTGVGIPAERINNLFNITSVSTPGTNNETGTALGLVMCKEFIEANGGRIWVESEVGKGSVFKFTLPYNK